ncbi:hypothetical protein [Nigerium massiliense]|uniref:hypothetical protein n=1 Tax=Nigerium massiliense TaxID=1522317 RepID=UPI00058C7FCE|nr:hypothetical protein [Nigerium massiliense]
MTKVSRAQRWISAVICAVFTVLLFLRYQESGSTIALVGIVVGIGLTVLWLYRAVVGRADDPDQPAQR